MAGVFSVLGYFLLIVAAIAIGSLLLTAMTGFRKADSDVLWRIFWAALITGIILVLIGRYVLFGQY